MKIARPVGVHLMALCAVARLELCTSAQVSQVLREEAGEAVFTEKYASTTISALVSSGYLEVAYRHAGRVVGREYRLTELGALRVIELRAKVERLIETGLL